MEISKLFGKSPRRRRKRMHLYLLNDNENSFEYVIESLSSMLPMCNRLRAEQIAILVDGHGECSIYSGFAPEIYVLYAHFQKMGLNVQIREYKSKRK
jgi:ATP-dependent Clp protease adapter protein ClpS